MLLQQGDVALQHRLGDERVEHQRVHVFTACTCTRTHKFMSWEVSSLQKMTEFVKYLNVIFFSSVS